MRAVAEDPSIATLMGVNTNSVISTTFMLGSGLAATAGVMISANYGIAHYYMGSVLGLKAFTAAVLGGIGNMYGAMVGGLLLGLIESLGGGLHWRPKWRLSWQPLSGRILFFCADLGTNLPPIRATGGTRCGTLLGAYWA